MDKLEIKVLEDIGGWGFTLNDLLSQVSGYEGSEITMPINSFGGDVFEGLAIYNAIKGMDKSFTANIVGYAMSMGTIIALAADEVTMPENGYFMIHEPWTATVGNSDDLEKDSKLLDKLAKDLVSIYAKKTKLPKSEIRAMMKEETWLTSREAKKLGFIDTIRRDKARVNASLFSSKYRNMPKEIRGGSSLASLLNNAIDDRITDSRTRADIIQSMASAANISENTVSQILSGSINCPPFETRLVPFGRVLNISQERLMEAGNRDGCDYNPENKIQNKMDLNKKLVMAFGVTEDEAKAGDFSKVENALASLAKVADIEARVSQNEETLDKSTEYVDEKLTEVKNQLQEKLDNQNEAVKTYTEHEVSELVAKIEALQTENTELKTKIDGNSEAIAGNLSKFEEVAEGMQANNMQSASNFFQKAKEVVALQPPKQS